MARIVADGVIKIGEDVVQAGDEKSSLIVNLPSDWTTKFDVVVAIASAGTTTSDWIYAHYSSYSTGGTFITSNGGVMYYIPLVVCKETNGKYYYKGLTANALEITPSSNDFMVIRSYTTNKLLIEGSHLTVYGFKTT